MKRIFFFVFFIFGILSINAQNLEDYNARGDQALREEEYQAARGWYSMGLDSCDPYSIEKLVEIWIKQESMRESMLLPMQVCYDCMEKIVVDRNYNMMLLFSYFYKHGIATQQNDSLYSYWYNEWWQVVYRTTLDIAPERLNFPEDSSMIKAPRKSLLSNRFCSFLTYTYSPTMPFGLTAGIYFDKIGGYVSYRTDFKSTDAAYECNNTKVPVIKPEPDGPLYAFNRERWQSSMITGGFLFPIVKNRLFASIGGGYGKRDYYREIISDNTFSTGNNSEWCYNTEASYEGLTLEAGGMFVWRKLTVLGGVNSTKFKDLDVYIGLGLTF